jgi:hypothetical protein
MWARVPMSGTGSLRVPSARRMGFPGARAGEPYLKRGFILRSAVTLSHFLQLLHPYTSESSTPLLHSHSSAFRRHSRHGLAGSSRALPDREGTRHGAPPARMECAGARLEDPGRRYSPWLSRCRGVCALCLLPFVRVGVADLALLHATAGGSRSPAPAPHTPLHPSGGHLRSPMRDVRGGGAVYLPLPPCFRAGEVREDQGPSQCVLLPDDGGFGRCLHLLPQRREVGKLACRMGDRQYRGQRPPRTTERRAEARQEAMEGQATVVVRVRARTGQDQVPGDWRSDIDACGWRLLEAPDRAAAGEGMPELLVHWLERPQPDSSRARHRPVLGGTGAPGEGAYW